MARLFKSLMAKVDREAWLRFFLALTGLALAFASAVFSSAASEAGNVVATAVFASVALFLAGVVGVLTVPYLARRVVAARVREHFHYEFTREGIAYLIAALLIGVAALNTANNLLFIILAAMLAAVFVSGIASAAILRRLELDIAVPSNAFAGRLVAVRVRVQNPRLWIPSFSVTVDAPSEKKRRSSGWEWQKSQFTFPKRRRWLQLPDYQLRRKPSPPKPAKGPTRPFWLTCTAPRSTGAAFVASAFPRRGFSSHDSLALPSSFPFSFLTKSRRVRLGRGLVVYPWPMETFDLLNLLRLVTGEFVSF